MKVLSTLQHSLTNEQLKEIGSEVTLLKDVNPLLAEQISNCPMSTDLLKKMVDTLINIIKENNFTQVILPGGSPAFMFLLTSTIMTSTWGEDVKFSFAHSERISGEQVMLDGSIKKVSVFRHISFIDFVVYMRTTDIETSDGENLVLTNLCYQ